MLNLLVLPAGAAAWFVERRRTTPGMAWTMCKQPRPKKLYERTQKWCMQQSNLHRDSAAQPGPHQHAMPIDDMLSLHGVCWRCSTHDATQHICQHPTPGSVSSCLNAPDKQICLCTMQAGVQLNTSPAAKQRSLAVSSSIACYNGH
jgi:hypothetical protein